MVSRLKTIDKIIWYRKNSPITKKGVQLFQNFKFLLPSLYFAILTKSDGGSLDYDFDYFDIEEKKNINTGFSCIYGLECDSDNLLHHYYDPPEFFPKDLVSFSEIANGDRLCFDYRDNPKTDDPPIVYWNHESAIDESVSFVSKNFDEFIKRLKEPEDKKEHSDEEFELWYQNLP